MLLVCVAMQSVCAGALLLFKMHLWRCKRWSQVADLPHISTYVWYRMHCACAKPQMLCVGLCPSPCRCTHGWVWSLPVGCCCTGHPAVAKQPLRTRSQTSAGCPSCACQRLRSCRACLVGFVLRGVACAVVGLCGSCGEGDPVQLSCLCPVAM